MICPGWGQCLESFSMLRYYSSLDDRKHIWPVKTYSSFVKSSLGSDNRLTQVHLKKWPLHVCVCCVRVYVSVCVCLYGILNSNWLFSVFVVTKWHYHLQNNCLTARTTWASKYQKADHRNTPQAPLRHAVNEPHVTASSMEATRQPGPHAKQQAGA